MFGGPKEHFTLATNGESVNVAIGPLVLQRRDAYAGVIYTLLFYFFFCCCLNSFNFFYLQPFFFGGGGVSFLSFVLFEFKKLLSSLVLI